MISNDFQSLLKNGFHAGKAHPAVAGQGRLAQSKTRRVRRAWYLTAGRRRSAVRTILVISANRRHFQRFPINSNQFQSLLEKY